MWACIIGVLLWTYSQLHAFKSHVTETDTSDKWINETN